MNSDIREKGLKGDEWQNKLDWKNRREKTAPGRFRLRKMMTCPIRSQVNKHDRVLIGAI